MNDPFGPAQEPAPNDVEAAYVNGHTGPAGASPFGGPLAPQGQSEAVAGDGSPVGWDEFLGLTGFGG